MNGALQSCLYHDRRTCSGLGRLHNESVALKRGTTGLLADELLRLDS